MERDPVEEILRFNRRLRTRLGFLLRRKFDLMASAPFARFWGRFHLFGRDPLENILETWQRSNPITGVEIPRIGDLHRESCGTYTAEDGILGRRKNGVRGLCR